MSSGRQIDAAALHRTPPPRPFKIKNPFERTLVERLNSHVCSPGMFKIRESPGSFEWDIEQVSILKPAHIVACSSQFEPTPDPALEKQATEAIEKYFSQEMIVPSPFGEVPKRNALPLNVVDANMTPECTKLSVWAQTNLSFPAILPPEVENVLKPFYNYNKDQSCVSEADISANSLRRKLCFEGEFSDDEEDYAIYTENNFKNRHQRGLKRSLEMSPKSSVSQDKIDSLFNMINRKPSSPILKADFKTRCESSEKIHLKSPSLSPIRHSSSSIKEEESPDTSSKNNSHHGIDISLFSQSTPEKSLSSNDINSTRDVFDSSEMNLIKRRFNDDNCQLGKNSLKLNKRSQSDLSLIFNKCKNSSVVNMDISSDGSVYGTRHYSHQNSEIDDSFDSLSLQNQISNDLEAPTSDFNFKLTKEEIAKMNARESDEFNFIPLYSLEKEDKENRNDITKIDDCYTPTKFGHVNNLHVYDTPVTTNQIMTIESPMQISPNISLCKGESNTNLNLETNMKFNVISSQKSNTIVTSFHRMDSGFSEFGSFQSVPFASNSIQDMTKSFQNNTTSTSVKWKRFDSGFHDETSSDFTHQISSNDSLKCSQKYLPIDEEAGHFDELNKTDVFVDNMVSIMNSQFSSTPSKMQFKRP